MTLVHSQSHSVVCSLCKISNKRTINENYEKCTQTVVCVLVCECAICAHTKSVPTFRRAFTFLLGVHTANKYLATKCRENSLQCVRQPTTRISALKFIRFFSLFLPSQGFSLWFRIFSLHNSGFQLPVQLDRSFLRSFVHSIPWKFIMHSNVIGLWNW